MHQRAKLVGNKIRGFIQQRPRGYRQDTILVKYSKISQAQWAQKSVQTNPTVVRRHGKTNKSNPRNVRAGYGTRELPVSGPKSRSSSKGGDKGSVQGLSRHSRVSVSRTWDPGQHLVRLSDCEMTGGVSNETNVKSLSPSRIILTRKRRPEQTK